MPGEGFEPPTFGLQNRCTTTVLTRLPVRRSYSAGWGPVQLDDKVFMIRRGSGHLPYAMVCGSQPSRAVSIMSNPDPRPCMLTRLALALVLLAGLALGGFTPAHPSYAANGRAGAGLTVDLN